MAFNKNSKFTTPRLHYFLLILYLRGNFIRTQEHEQGKN